MDTYDARSSDTVATAIAIVMREHDCDSWLASSRLVSEARETRRSVRAVATAVVAAGTSAADGPAPIDAA